MSRRTLDPAGLLGISSTGFSPSLICFPKTVRLSLTDTARSPQPHKTRSRGLAFSHFARRYFGNRGFFLLLRVLRCFSSPRLPSPGYGFTRGYSRFARVGFPIQKSPDQWLFAPPRSFSQLITSFIGSQCQGIRPAPLFA